MYADVYIYVPGRPATWFYFTGDSDKEADGDKRLVLIGDGIFESGVQGNLAGWRVPPRVVANIPGGRVIMTKVSSERTVNDATGEYDEVLHDKERSCTVI